MIETSSIAGFSSLGRLEQSALELACKNAVEAEGKHVIDGIDHVCRKAWGNSPGHVVRQLREKGYLIYVGEVMKVGSSKRQKRHQIIFNPGLVDVVKPKTEKLLQLEIELGQGEKKQKLTLPIDATFQLSLSGKGFSINLRST